ncbi:hypothetical protein ACFFK7_12595 [Pseudoalteromonas xiamenensis]|uniref:hypothetical protein n=1 Tax=Pseudoalteromonas xiamenensis TaxID=882626 RepID=UPI0035EF0439
MSTAQTLADAVSALNNVATSHEQLNATMTAQQDVVEANFKALQDFATHPDTATFKDKNGTSFPVKSLRKLAADAEAVNPNPHVMTKAEFDALRELRKSQYAGSGFVEFGQANPVFWNHKGLWLYGGWRNALAIGSNKWFDSNKGKTGYPKVNVNGVILTLEGITGGAVGESNFIRLPPPPNGKKTYDSATGIVTEHLSTEVAFASETATNKVILTRKDFVFLEVWPERLSENDVVHVKGNVQWVFSSWFGVTLSNNLVPQSYSSSGEWDTNTLGYCARWSSLTTSERNKFLSDPENNIYYDSELSDYVQYKYRVRVIEGLTDTWNAFLPNQGRSSYNKFLSVSGTENNVVAGRFSSVANDRDLTVYNPQAYSCFMTSNNLDGPSVEKDLGLYITEGVDFGFGIPILTLQRLNSGAYEPSLNPFGCGRFLSTDASYDASFDDLNVPQFGGWRPKTTFDCFLEEGQGKAIFNGVTGRCDTWYGDPNFLSLGLVEDLRLDAKKLNPQTLLNEATKDSIAARLRGKQKLKFTRFDSLIYQSSGSASGYLYIDANGWERPKSVHEKIKGWNITKNKAVTLSMNPGSQHVFDVVADDASLIEKNDQIMLSYYRIDQSQTFEHLPCCDVAGHPLDIYATFPVGVCGEWIPVPEPSASLAANQKIVGVFKKLVTKDYGLSWLNGSMNTDLIKNHFTDGILSGEVQLYFYVTSSAFTQVTDNLGAVVLGDVVVSGDTWDNQGNRLAKSLLGFPTNDNQDGNQLRILKMEQVAVNKDGVLWPTNKPRHSKVDMMPTLYNSSAVKSLISIVEKNGLYYLQFNGAELKHNGTDWGDDQTIPIINGEDVKTDLNGNTVKVFCHHSVYPLGIAHND